jgi:hypothetical protein
VGTRLDAWRRLLGEGVAQVTRDSPERLSLTLREDADIAAPVHLGRQEKACCAFIDFTLRLDAGAVVLVVEVPAAGAAVLDDFAGLAGAA